MLGAKFKGLRPATATITNAMTNASLVELGTFCRFVSLLHCWRTPMRSLGLILIVALGLVAGAVTSAHADRWPADLWERLDRERF